MKKESKLNGILKYLQNLYPFAERSEPRGFPKQPSVRCKSKGQNPELWPAGPALLLALWRPAGP